MENEEKTPEEKDPVKENYLDVIKKLKETTVSKDEYDRVVKENQTLANAFATTPAAPAAEEKKHVYTQKEIDALAAHISGGHLSNLEFTKTALAYRKAVMEVHGVDPFLANNSGYVPSEADRQASENLAENLRQIAEYAGDDDALFNSELKRCGR